MLFFPFFLLNFFSFFNSSYADGIDIDGVNYGSRIDGKGMLRGEDSTTDAGGKQHGRSAYSSGPAEIRLHVVDTNGCGVSSRNAAYAFVG